MPTRPLPQTFDELKKAASRTGLLCILLVLNLLYVMPRLN